MIPIRYSFRNVRKSEHKKGSRSFGCLLHSWFLFISHSFPCKTFSLPLTLFGIPSASNLDY